MVIKPPLTHSARSRNARDRGQWALALESENPAATIVYRYLYIVALLTWHLLHNNNARVISGLTVCAKLTLVKFEFLHATHIRLHCLALAAQSFFFYCPIRFSPTRYKVRFHVSFTHELAILMCIVPNAVNVRFIVPAQLRQQWTSVLIAAIAEFLPPWLF